MNVAAYLRLQSREFGNKLAIIDGNKETTYTRLEEVSNQVANWLKDTGVKPGERAVVYLPNCTEYLFFIHGMYKAGVVAIPLNYRFQKEELKYVFSDSGASVVVTLKQHEKVMSELKAEGAAIRQIALTDSTDRDAANICLQEIIDKYPAETEIYTALDSELGMLMYTSGTTGKPKGVKQTHRNIVTGGECLAYPNHVNSSDRFFCIAPLFHVGGIISTICVMRTGGVVVFSPAGWNPVGFLETVEKHKVTWAFLVGLMGAQLAMVEDLGKYDLSSLRHVIFGGSPIPAAMYAKFEARYQCKTFELYGRTEHVGPSILYDVTDKRVPGSVGKMVGQTIKGKLIDPVTGREVAVGEPGELVVMGDNQTPGYWNKPEENAKLLTADGWQHTGDVFTRNADGYYFFKERVDDMIISGGENVYPGEIVPILTKHPKVADAFVLGIQHEAWGQQVAAVIVKRDESLTEQEILDYCSGREDLSGYKKPRAIRFVKEIPKTASQKIDKGASLKLFQ